MIEDRALPIEDRTPKHNFSINKILYGLKQAARQFFIFLSNLLKELGYILLKVDQSVFYNIKNNIIIVVYINNLLIFAFNKEDINTLKE